TWCTARTRRSRPRARAPCSSASSDARRPLPAIVLASRSPQRREILARLGLDFTVRVSEAAELEDGDPEAIAVENALRKARAVARPGELVIGCDTIVVLDGRIYGKPG